MRLRCYFGILGNYFFRTCRHPKTPGVGITRRVNKTFLDIIKRFSRYGRAFVGFTRVETHVNCYFSREIVFKAWLHCKKRTRSLLTSSRVCITVSNSPNACRVYIRLCKHGKRFLLLNYNYGCALNKERGF